MELNHFHIGEGDTGSEGERKSVTGIFVTARRAASPQSRVSTGRENDRVCEIRCAVAGLQVECHRTEADAVADQQS